MPSHDNSKAVMAKLRAPMEATHRGGQHLTHAWRHRQLTLLMKLVVNHREEWLDALAQDLGKDRTEAVCTELLVVEAEIKLMLKKLKSWMAPTGVAGPSHCWFGWHWVEHRPLLSPGVLIIGPYNYPVQLTIMPAAGSLAGGNPTLIKPSELTPRVSALLHKLVSLYFEPGALQVVEGGVKETSALLEQQWGLVFFTGSERVGKIVAQQTAKTLTPTVLELGGKAPAIVDETAPSDMRAVANRIIWGKTLNSGQTCVAPDYVVCHHSHVDTLCKEMLKTLECQFTKDPASSELGRIVQPSHAQRLVDLLKEVEQQSSSSSSSTKLLCGGSAKCNVAACHVAPTLVLNPPRNCRLLREEIFGPILPIVVVQSREEAIEFVNERPGTPLALYVFTKWDKVYQEILDKCPAASGMHNDAVMQASSPYLPIGGLGSSGYGKYHGRYSFDTFTHAFASSYRPCAPGMDFHMVRYHPFAGVKAFILRNVLLKVPALPVVHTRWLLAVLGVVLLVRFVPAAEPAVETARHGCATVLEAAAKWIRGNDAGSSEE